MDVWFLFIYNFHLSFLESNTKLQGAFEIGFSIKS